MELLIETEDIILGGKKILNKASLKLAGGNSYCVTGKNGAGKTTLMEYIAANPNVSVRMDNKKLQPVEFKQMMAYIPNDPPLFEMLTGYENIHYIMALWKIKEKDRYRRKVRRYCRLLNLDKEDLARQVHTYSLGMKFKLFFIAMFSRDIRILLLDEPFTALDKDSRHTVFELLKTFVNEGNILVFVTHIEEFREKLGQHIMEIEDQTVICHW